ncbi:MAG: hypothetical protein RIR01_2336 [Bacteroidota bacterium]
MAIRQFITGFKTFVVLTTCMLAMQNLYTTIQYGRLNAYYDFDVIDWSLMTICVLFNLSISVIDAITTTETCIIQTDTDTLSYLEKTLPFIPDGDFKQEITEHIENIYVEKY